MDNKPQYNQTIEKRQSKLKEALISTLKEMPIIEVAVKRIGIGRDTYYRWKAQDKDFFKRSQEAMMQGIEFINDLSESQIIALIKDKKMSSIKFWLRHNHPKYKERIEITTNTQPQEELNPEQAAIVKEALRLSSMPDLTATVDEEYQPNGKDQKSKDEEKELAGQPRIDQAPKGPRVVTFAEFAVMKRPLKEPVIVKTPNKETTHFPDGSSVAKLAGGATVYSPPDQTDDLPKKPSKIDTSNYVYMQEPW